MKLLFTADLHFRLHWFRWLIEQAPSYDLVCIAGDLLDMFKSETRLEQAREVRIFIRELADLVPVAVCSGQKVPKSFSAVWRRKPRNPTTLETSVTRTC
jgi:uncharacterized protein